MYESFKEHCKAADIDMSGMHHEKADKYDIVLFGTMSPTEASLYEVAIVLYEDEDTADIFVRKRINSFNENEMLYIVNELNKQNRWVSFHFTEHSIVLKSSCLVDSMEDLFDDVYRNITMAGDCFIGIGDERSKRETSWIN